MRDNNIIQDAINCITILKYEIRELKAENEKLRELLNHYQEEAEALRSYETYKIWLNNEYREENERLKEELKSYGATGVCEVCSDKANKLADKYLGCLQEIKAIAEAPKPFTDFSVTKTATEVGYDYAVICNELELSLHKVLELIAKAESEG